MARGRSPPQPDVVGILGLHLASDLDDDEANEQCACSSIDGSLMASCDVDSVVDIRDAPHWRLPTDTGTTTAFGWGDEANIVGVSPDEPLDFDQIIQELLLQQGLLEDQEGLESLGFELTPLATPQIHTPLRDLRRTGALGGLTENAQTTLLAGTLFEYSHQGAAAPPTPSAPPSSTPLRSPPLGLTAVAGSGLTASATDFLRLSLNRVLHPPAPSSQLAASDFDSIDSVDGSARTVSSSLFAPSTEVAGSDRDRSANELDGHAFGAREIRSAAVLLGAPRSARSTGIAGAGLIGLESPQQQQPSTIHESTQEDGLQEIDPLDTEDGTVSVMAYDSPRESASWSVMTPQAQGFGMLPLTALDGSSGFEDMGLHSGVLSTARSESEGQPSARTLLGETLSLEGGLDVGLADVLHRLAIENLSLDESISRSVRRVLQLGTVLTGQRLSDEEIRALPKVRFEQAEQQNCSICLESYQQGELLNRLRCGHFFHVECLTRWMQRATQCPLCRDYCTEGGDI